MIDSALAFLKQEINDFVQKRTGSASALDTGGLADDQGKWTFHEGLRLALVAVEEDRTLREQLPERVYIKGDHVLLQPAVKLDLVIVVAAHFPDYGDSLRYLSHAITFFQANPAFTPEEFPGLDPRIERLAPEMLSLGAEQLNQMWAYIGTRYLPSVAYRVRMVVLQDAEPMGIGKPVMRIAAALHDK